MLIVVLISQCEKDEPEPEVTLPDDWGLIKDKSFLNALVERGVDTNGDSIISYPEAEAVKFLDLSNCGISDMSGIELFANLEKLYCNDNQLTTLDVSHNTTLGRFNCSHNQLTTLDISNNTALGGLYLAYIPSLYEVCVWEMPFPPAGVNVDTTGSPNVYFTTDCSN